MLDKETRRFRFKWRRGSDLTPEEQARAKIVFPDRHTAETPSAHMTKEGAALTFETDADWLAGCEFAVHDDGTIDERAISYVAHPLFPRNPELWGPEQREAERRRLAVLPATLPQEKARAPRGAQQRVKKNQTATLEMLPKNE